MKYHVPGQSFNPLAAYRNNLPKVLSFGGRVYLLLQGFRELFSLLRFSSFVCL